MNLTELTACSQYRILGNGEMTAGFLLWCVSTGVRMQSDAGWAATSDTSLEALLLCSGAVLFVAGFAVRLCFWRCPHCRCHLMLCAKGNAVTCPVCGRKIR